MTQIVNTFNHPVILDDQRDPDVSWQHHLQRNSAGGVDLAYPMYTPVALPASGSLSISGTSGSGGRTGTLSIDHSTIAYIQMMHLSGGTPGNYEVGATPIQSGASGFGDEHYYSPHLHVHAYDKQNRRVNLFHYFDKSSTAGGGSSPLAAPTTGDIIMLVNNVSNPDQYYIATWEPMAATGFPCRLTVRPTLGLERKVLLAATPQVPRCQMTDAELADFCSQGGYVWDNIKKVGLSFGVPIFWQ